MFTPQIKEREKDKQNHRFYGLGWHIDQVASIVPDSTIKIFEYGGDVTSFETLLTLVPNLNAVVIILYNHGETDQNSFRDDLIKVILQYSDKN